MKLGPQENHQTFKLNANFTNNPESERIDLLNETVSFQVGTFSATLPAGSFHKHDDGSFWFSGMIGAVVLWAKITRLGGRDYQFQAIGKHADLSGTAIPVTVGLSIGQDRGTISLKNTLLMAGSNPVSLPTTEP
jgi:hypothetical protein